MRDLLTLAQTPNISNLPTIHTFKFLTEALLPTPKPLLHRLGRIENTHFKLKQPVLEYNVVTKVQTPAPSILVWQSLFFESQTQHRILYGAVHLCIR